MSGGVFPGCPDGPQGAGKDVMSARRSSGHPALSGIPDPGEHCAPPLSSPQSGLFLVSELLEDPQNSL